MARLMRKPRQDSSDDELPDIEVLLKQKTRPVRKVTDPIASKSSFPTLNPQQPPIPQRHRVRRLGGTKTQDLENPLLQRWDTGEYDGLSSSGPTESAVGERQGTSAAPTRNDPRKSEQPRSGTPDSSPDVQTRPMRNRRPRISPELADDSDDANSEDSLSLRRRIEALQSRGDKTEEPSLRSKQPRKCSAQTTRKCSEDLSFDVLQPPKPQTRVTEEIRIEDSGIEDEDSLYQTAVQSESEDSDSLSSDFFPGNSIKSSTVRGKPSLRNTTRKHSSSSGKADQNRLHSYGSQAGESKVAARTEASLDTDLANTFSKLRLQLVDFADEDSEPSRTNRPSTPPPRGKHVQPKELKSPRKQPLIPRTPHKANTDAFWSQDVVNDWNDKHSPSKPIFAPKAIGSPIKMSPSKQQKKLFIESRQAMAEDFLKELDEQITQGRIAELAESTGGVRLVWSKTLNTTAGRANWKREAIRSKQESGTTTQHRHHANIELAEKVIDSEDRLLNTLAHEFCHLATFMIDNITKNPHGANFQAWGAKCTRAFGKSHGIEVTTKHSYAIDYKYIWRCGSCVLEYKRHSKSIDPARHRCGSCKGVLAQIKPVPRKAAGKGDVGSGSATGGGKLSDYQIFMKEQMKIVRQENPGSPQKEVMRIVADRWAKKTGKVKGKASSSIDDVVDQLEILTVED
ncbi:HMG box-containing protein C19G7.04 [Paramyrothecium foliicola]|nr:HMG box-containing protein C19G7.04 [Paramyrothecium foliicola]